MAFLIYCQLSHIIMRPPTGGGGGGVLKLVRKRLESLEMYIFFPLYHAVTCCDSVTLPSVCFFMFKLLLWMRHSFSFSISLPTWSTLTIYLFSD